MISTALGIAQGRYTLAAQADTGIRCRSRLHLVNDRLAIYGINHDLAAQCRYRKGNGHGGIEIAVFSLEDRMPLYNDLNQKISSRTSVNTRLTLIPYTHTLTVVYTGRY